MVSSSKILLFTIINTFLKNICGLSVHGEFHVPGPFLFHSNLPYISAYYIPTIYVPENNNVVCTTVPAAFHITNWFMVSQQTLSKYFWSRQRGFGRMVCVDDRACTTATWLLTRMTYLMSWEGWTLEVCLEKNILPSLNRPSPFILLLQLSLQFGILGPKVRSSQQRT